MDLLHSKVLAHNMSQLRGGLEEVVYGMAWHMELRSCNVWILKSSFGLKVGATNIQTWMILAQGSQLTSTQEEGSSCSSLAAFCLLRWVRTYVRRSGKRRQTGKSLESLPTFSKEIRARKAWSDFAFCWLPYQGVNGVMHFLGQDQTRHMNINILDQLRLGQPQVWARNTFRHSLAPGQHCQFGHHRLLPNQIETYPSGRHPLLVTVLASCAKLLAKVIGKFCVTNFPHCVIMLAGLLCQSRRRCKLIHFGSKRPSGCCLGPPTLVGPLLPFNWHIAQEKAWAPILWRKIVQN